MPWQPNEDPAETLDGDSETVQLGTGNYGFVEFSKPQRVKKRTFQFGFGMESSGASTNKHPSARKRASKPRSTTRKPRSPRA